MLMYPRQRDVPMALTIPGGFIVGALGIMLANLCPYGANNDNKITIHNNTPSLIAKYILLRKKN